MDRYIIREPRAGVDYPEGNQMTSFSTTNAESNFGYPQSMYHTYAPESQGYMTHITHGSVVTPAQTFGSNFYQNQGHIVSGIDPRYLAAYSDTNGSFIATGQRECPSTSFDLFGNYQNRNFIGPERGDYKHYPQRTHVGLKYEIPL
nr:uncharacterized protein LOC116770266 [Danaus plexippus plexippus]